MLHPFGSRGDDVGTVGCHLHYQAVAGRDQLRRAALSGEPREIEPITFSNSPFGSPMLQILRGLF